MLRFPRALWLALLAATVLALPSLAAYHYCDDQLFIVRLEGILPAVKNGPFSLYAFAGDAPAAGPFWWASPDLRMAFMRPLSSALFAVDHAVWGRAPLPYHLHSVAWFVAAVALAAALYRKLLGAREGALAALLFAVTPLHVMAAYWPAARHVAMAGVLGFAALFVHLRARERGRVPYGGAILAALAMLSSEAGLGVLGYVFAYELLGRQSPWRGRASIDPERGAEPLLAGRVAALAPYAVVAVAYLVAYRTLGFGVRGSGNYADPLRDPLAFVLNLPKHLGPLTCAAFYGVPSEASVAFPAMVLPAVCVGLLTLVAFVFLLRRALHVMSEPEARTIRWLLLGALLAAVPGMGGIVGDRVLFLPSLGLSASFAVVILNAARGATTATRPAHRPLGARALVALLVVFQAGLAPLSFLGQGMAFARSSRAAIDIVGHAEIPHRPGLRVFGVGISDPLIGMYLQPALVLSGSPAVDVTMLSVSLHDHVVRRTDDTTLEIEVNDGTLLENGFETVVRPTTSPFRAGDVVTLSGFTVRILDAVLGRPRRFAVTFDRSLSDPTLVLVLWQDGALRRLVPPAIGGSLTVRHEKGPSGF